MKIFYSNGPTIIPQIEKKFAIKGKESIIFKSKSFRDFIKNNNRKNYDEYLKCINTTYIISHFNESDNSLLIQSLNV